MAYVITKAYTSLLRNWKSAEEILLSECKLWNAFAAIFSSEGIISATKWGRLYERVSFYKGDISKTEGTIENRFRILIQISLSDKKNSRIDDFSEELKRHTVSIQRLVVIDTLKAPSQVKRKRSRSTFTESWDKKQKPPIEKQDVGLFRKPPDKTLSIPDTDNRHTSESQLMFVL